MDISHLSEKSQELFNFYSGKAARTPGQKTLLIRALEALDLADNCQKIIINEGFSVTSERSGLTRKHPLLDAQKEATATMLKIFKLLNLQRKSYPGEFGWKDYELDS